MARNFYDVIKTSMNGEESLHLSLTWLSSHFVASLSGGAVPWPWCVEDGRRIPRDPHSALLSVLSFVVILVGVCGVVPVDGSVRLRIPVLMIFLRGLMSCCGKLVWRGAVAAR